MAEIVLAGNAGRVSQRFSRLALGALFASWFAVVLVLGVDNFFVTAQGAPPLALLTAATGPIAILILAVLLFPTIREVALTADLKFVTGVQGWRLGGYSFLILYSYGQLPGYFAWPAGLGDMFIGATAPFILPFIGRAGVTKSKTFIAWNVLGILDLVVAVGMGSVGAFLFGNSSQPFPTTAMSHMPLVLIPTYFVPTFVIFHLVALLQARQVNPVAQSKM